MHGDNDDMILIENIINKYSYIYMVGTFILIGTFIKNFAPYVPSVHGSIYRPQRTTSEGMIGAIRGSHSAMRKK